MSAATLTISFADPAAADAAESVWLRLEQVELPDEAATLERAAELIDALYGLTPCEDGLGGGGEEADEEALPEEEEFLDMARDTLDLSMCDESAAATWEAEVDVLRSRRDEGYGLEGELITVGETTIMSATKTETLDVDGARIDLAWPCAGDVVVSGAGAAVREVRGSTVILAAPVKGRVRVRYRSVWDRVRLRVRASAAAPSGGLAGGILDVAGGASKTSREEDAAVVVCFWRDLATECRLTRPPADEQDIDRAELDRLCNRKVDWQVAGECWETVERFDLCKCSGEEAPDVESEDVDVPCGDARPGSWLGTRREFREYVDCPGEEEDELSDPEFFKDHCCEEHPRPDLPRCRETREPHRGGAEIENGPEHWRELYGESVRLTAVLPEGGRCGELVRVWAVPEEIEGGPALPASLSIDSGETFTVTVTSGGRPPFAWTPPPGVAQIGSAAYGFMGIFRADPTFIGGTLSVADACGRSAEVMLAVAGLYWVELNMTYDLRFDPPDQPYRRIALQRAQTRPLGRCVCRHDFWDPENRLRPFCDSSVDSWLDVTKCLHDRFYEYDSLMEVASFVSASGRYLAQIDNYFDYGEFVSGRGDSYIARARCGRSMYAYTGPKPGKCLVRKEDWEPRARTEIADRRYDMNMLPDLYTFLDGYLEDDGFVIHGMDHHEYYGGEFIYKNYAWQNVTSLYALGPCVN